MRRRELLSAAEALKREELSLGQGKVATVKFTHQKSLQEKQDEKENKALVDDSGHHQKTCEDIALVALLRDCAKRNDLQKGSRLHAKILKRGSLEDNVFIGNTLVSMYGKCGALDKARRVFEELRFQNVVSWTALIAGYADHGYGEEAMHWFEQMQLQGLSPDEQTFACVLKACASLGDAGKGEDIHAKISEKGWLRRNIVLGNASVDMFAKCGALVKAQEVFDELPAPNIISWNALMTGYVQQGKGEEALDCFEQMQSAGGGLSPSVVTFACVLKACGIMAAARKGAEIHTEMARRELLGKNGVIGTALVDMYIKCGAFSKAREAFDQLTVRNVVSWTALLAGYSQIGGFHETLDLFRRMVGEGIRPNMVTFVILLNACRYLGLINEGQTYFEDMSARYGIAPASEHHTCMVDLLACSGHFDMAMGVMKRMPPSSEYLPAWSALLGACERWGNVRVGNLAFTHAVRLNERSSVPYVWMRNIYETAGMQEDADRIEAMRIEKAVCADLGCG